MPATAAMAIGVYSLLYLVAQSRNERVQVPTVPILTVLSRLLSSFLLISVIHYCFRNPTSPAYRRGAYHVFLIAGHADDHSDLLGSRTIETPD